MFGIDLDASVDTLEQGLLAREAMIAALRCQQADILRTLDVIDVRHMDGAASLQEWTRSRLDVSAATARDLVDAARSFGDQPSIVDLAEAGNASFDRLVATSRLVASGADEATVTHSFGLDLHGVARMRNLRRRMTRRSEKQVFSDRYFDLQETLDGSSGRLRGQLPGFEFRLVSKALTERADMFNDLPGPRIGKAQRMADALVSISQDSLEPVSDGTGGGQRSDPLATILVDAGLASQTAGAAGAEIEYGPRVGPQTLERILCGGRVQVVGIADGKPVKFSPAARAISPAIRRFVAWRDGGCTIAGCTSRYRLQPHHVQHRADHGDDNPDNLATLCWFHHHVVAHGMGLQLDPESPQQRRRFIRNHPGHDPP